MRIRHGGHGDIEEMLALWEVAGSPPTSTNDASSVGRLIQRDPAAVFVAEKDGDIIGTLFAAWDGWRGSMYRMAVHPDHRRKGVARALVAEGEEHLRAIGCKRITAIVLAEEAHANEFWSAVGYSLQPEVGRYTKNA
jgi:ribosomal protein S18 acetylase RimI-like enzyme